jgi:hypothetical protein
VVLTRLILSACLLAGCKQSLFAEHGGGDDDGMHDANGSDTDGDATVQSSCGVGCLGDAAADFGTSTWKYFDDHRDRTWSAMTSMGSAYVGANPANRIASSSGVLLVSTAGQSDPADPAIAFTSATNQTIRLSIIVDVPAGASTHTMRLYRNSREDSLVTKVGLAGTKIEAAIAVDALAGDRFVLALAPNAAGGSDLAVSFFVNETTMIFPTVCKLGLQFEGTNARSVPNACGSEIGYWHDNGDNSSTATEPALTASAFPELGMAADIALDNYFAGDNAIDRSGDTTTQFWIKHRAFGTETATLYSDLDCDSPDGGGLVIYKHYDMGLIGFQTCTAPQTPDYRSVALANEFDWHFVRVVSSGGKLSLCVDGTLLSSFTPAVSNLGTVNPPYVGKNVDYSPVGAYLDAAVDDVRVLTTALPCN